MSKKLLMAALIAAFVLAAAGCNPFVGPADTGGGLPFPDENGKGESNGVAGNGEDEGGEEALAPDDPEAPLSYFGKTMDQIIAQLGRPEERGYFEGSEYFSYSGHSIYLFFWANPGEETVVRGIQLSAGAEALGLRVGMTFAEIKAFFGPPIFEGYSDYEENYTLICDYGEFRFFFASDSPDGPTTYVRIKYLVDS